MNVTGSLDPRQLALVVELGRELVAELRRLNDSLEAVRRNGVVLVQHTKGPGTGGEG